MSHLRSTMTREQLAATTCPAARQLGGLLFRCDRPRYTMHQHHYHRREDGTVISWRERLQSKPIGERWA